MYRKLLIKICIQGMKLALCLCMISTILISNQTSHTYAANEQKKIENNENYQLSVEHILIVDSYQFIDMSNKTISLSLTQLEKGYDVLKHQYKKKGIKVVEKSIIINKDDFKNKKCVVKIHYQLDKNYKAQYNKPLLKSQYMGTFDDITIMPIKTIKVAFNYKFSAYGALPGMSAHTDEDTILEESENGTFSLDYQLPTISGYNIALDETPLQDCLDENNNVIVSDEIHENAWKKARIAVIDGVTYTYDVKTNRIKAEGLTKDTKLNIYYRRMQGTYAVKHQRIDGQILKIEEKQPGRVGALTNAKALDIPGYSSQSFSQQVIKKDGSTVVTILYETTNYRIVFDTQGGNYIARQTVKIDENIDFRNVVPTKKGYIFAGWQYQDKNGKLVELSIENDQFMITNEFLNNIKVSNTDSMKSITLIAKWEPEVSSVTVVFWTEDPDYTTTSKNPKIDSGAFSNVGSFQLQYLKSEDSLVEEKDGQQVLKADIQKNIDEQFREKMGYVYDSDLDTDGNYNGTHMGEVAVADFYSLSKDMPYRILVDDKQGNEVDGTKVAADGSTLIYVFYVRNIYTLRFHYYTDDYKLYSNTVSLSYHNGTPSAGQIKNIDQSELMVNGKPKLERTITVSAKYGTDLRSLWPNTSVSLKEEGYSTNWNFISWATTAGRYNQKYIIDAKNAGDPYSQNAESTVMGLYGSMSSEIVANPKNPEEVHDLYAFWTSRRINYYQYNHCYEIPNMKSDDLLKDDVKVISDSIGDVDVSSEKNKLYLLPVQNDIFQLYEFSDLLIVDENGDTLDSNREQGYYAIRQFDDPSDGVTKYYAIGRRVLAKSTNAIQEQTPSARLHLSRVNGLPDHNTQYNDEDGRYTGIQVGAEDNPYNLYFYYNRDRYRITYMVNDEELGIIELPYGALLDETKYGFKKEDGNYSIHYKMKNDDSILTQVWTPIKDDKNQIIKRDVCPDKLPQGTKPWTFSYWSLGPAGTRKMNWTNDAKTNVVVESNLRLYAQWEAPEYKIIFDWNNGVAIEASQIAPKVQILKGGQSLSTNGIIPRLIRNGYILEGWKIVKCDSYPDFVGNDYDLNMNLYSDITIQADWKSDNTKITDYSVRYVTIENGKEVEIAPTKIVRHFHYSQGIKIWEKPVKPTVNGYETYVPVLQNDSLILKEEASENVLTFYYTISNKKSYTLRYINKETGQIVYRAKPISGYFSALTVYPSETDLLELNKLGYYLIDKKGNRVTNMSQVTHKIVLSEEKPEQIIDIYVKPIVYSITYKGIDAYQSIVGKLGNKEKYKVTDSPFRLKNPTKFIKDGITYTFEGWKLVSGTQEISGLDFNGKETSHNVTIQEGTKGNLTFMAIWSPPLKDDVSVIPNDSKKDFTVNVDKNPIHSKESKGKENQQKNIVKTNDHLLFELWLSMSIISLFGLVLLISSQKKYDKI